MINQEILFKTLKHYGISVDKDYIMSNHLETVDHIVRCSQLAKEFGVYLNLKKNDLVKLIDCALLHDIGKFQLEPTILYKAERLTDDEFAYIKGHINIEGDINSLDKCILDCIKYHHDNSLKTGYNKVDVSTKHEFIKIISLIDCYDAMTNKRCYKDFTLSLNTIVEDIENNIGKQFDSFYGHKFIEFISQMNIKDEVS